VYQSETRRATYNLPITLKQIYIDIAKTITGTTDFAIKCYHDYKEILVSTDTEFQEIVNYHSEKTLPLRIRIFEKEENLESSTIKSYSPTCSPISSPQIKRKVEVENSHNVNCSLCSNKIYGIRWKCTVCPNYDLCNICEHNHPRSHPLIRIVEELPLRSEVVFSVCTGLNQLNQKIDKISESTPISSATNTAKTAKDEITEFFCDLTTQAINNTTLLTHEIEGFVLDASKAVQKIPTKIKDLQTRLSEMLICNPAQPPASVPQENISRTSQLPVFSEQLELLQNMGFTQRETNLKLLTKHHGNIEFCISELLQD